MGSKEKISLSKERTNVLEQLGTLIHELEGGGLSNITTITTDRSEMTQKLKQIRTNILNHELNRSSIPAKRTISDDNADDLANNYKLMAIAIKGGMVDMAQKDGTSIREKRKGLLENPTSKECMVLIDFLTSTNIKNAMIYKSPMDNFSEPSTSTTNKGKTTVNLLSGIGLTKKNDKKYENVDDSDDDPSENDEFEGKLNRKRSATSGSSSSSSSSSSSNSTVESSRGLSSSVTSEDNRDRRRKNKITSNAITFVKALADHVINEVKTEGIFRVSAAKSDKDNLFDNYSDVTYLNKTGSAHLLEEKDVKNILKKSLKGADAPVHICAGSLNDILKNPQLIGLAPLTYSDYRNTIINGITVNGVNTNLIANQGSLEKYLEELPASHIKVLETVFRLLFIIMKNADANLMNQKNTGIAVGLALQKFMGLDDREPLPTDMKLAGPFQQKSAADAKVVTDFLMGWIPDAATTQNFEESPTARTFTKVLTDKHSYDKSDSVYKTKDELDSAVSPVNSGKYFAWNLSRSSSVEEETHDIGEAILDEKSQNLANTKFTPPVKK